jgi:hypothetical protein
VVKNIVAMSKSNPYEATNTNAAIFSKNQFFPHLHQSSVGLTGVCHYEKSPMFSVLYIFGVFSQSKE